jgi:hypothetical protein
MRRNNLLTSLDNTAFVSLCADEYNKTYDTVRRNKSLYIMYVVLAREFHLPVAPSSCSSPLIISGHGTHFYRHGVSLDLWGSLEVVQGDRRGDFMPNIHAEDVERVLTRFDACIRDGGSYEIVYRAVHHNKVLTLKSNSVTHKNADGSERCSTLYT